MLYFHSFKNPGFILDIVQDIRALNEFSRESRKAGMIVLGGGVCKHQIANAMLIVSARPYLNMKVLLIVTQRSAMEPITLCSLFVTHQIYHELA